MTDVPEMMAQEETAEYIETMSPPWMPPRAPGAVLSDRELRVGRYIVPLNPNAVQPVSIDLTLGDRVGIGGTPRTRDNQSRGYIDPKRGVLPEITYRTISDDKPYRLEAGTFVLGQTAETITVPDDCVAFVWNRSSLARIGLLNNPMAGLADPGWQGVLTLEFYNMSRYPIILTPGMPAGQLVVMRLTSPAERPYGSDGLGSKYQGASSVEGAKA